MQNALYLDALFRGGLKYGRVIAPEVEERWITDAFCRVISAHDEDNHALWLPAEPNVVERDVSLASDTLVYGEYLLSVWWAHWPRLSLEGYDDEYNLAERAETCKRTFDGIWIFINGTLRDCKFVETDRELDYTVHSTVCGSLFAIERR